MTQPTPLGSAQGEQRSWRKEYALPLALAVVALFGGVPAAVVAASDDKPPYGSCGVFSKEIGAQVKDGLPFESFIAWDEPEIEDHCGEAHDIAIGWSYAEEAPRELGSEVAVLVLEASDAIAQIKADSPAEVGVIAGAQQRLRGLSGKPPDEVVADLRVTATELAALGNSADAAVGALNRLEVALAYPR